MPGRGAVVFIRVPRSLVAGEFLAALAFCCTTDFDLQRHLQQFYPPFTGLVACIQNEAPVFYLPESQPL